MHVNQYFYVHCIIIIVALVDSNAWLLPVLWYHCCQNATSLLHIPSTIATDEKEYGIVYVRYMHQLI